MRDPKPYDPYPLTGDEPTFRYWPPWQLSYKFQFGTMWSCDEHHRPSFTFKLGPLGWFIWFRPEPDVGIAAEIKGAWYFGE